MMIENFPPTYQIIEASSCAEVTEFLSGGKIDYAILDMVLTDGNLLSIVEQIEGLRALRPISWFIQ